MLARHVNEGGAKDVLWTPGAPTAETQVRANAFDRRLTEVRHMLLLCAREKGGMTARGERYLGEICQ